MNHMSSVSTKTALVVFVKNPELGKVKTRLAAQIGDEKALEIYLNLLNYTHSVATSWDAHVRVYYSDFIPDLDLWDVGFGSKHLQNGSNLGQRLLHAVSETFNEDYEQVIVIGSDCPRLSVEHLNKARTELNDVDVVVGPAKDGGYYLIAMKSQHGVLFEDKSWSSPSLFDQTIETMIKEGLLWYELPILGDIDTVEDMERYSYMESVLS
jgi:rSAM/selenodomain-associated transferase 1